MADQYAAAAAAGEVPDADRLVVTGRHDARAIRSYGERVDVFDVAFEDLLEQARGEGPDEDLAAVAARDDPGSVGSHRDCGHLVENLDVAIDSALELAGPEIPDSHRVVVTAADRTNAIGRGNCRPDLASVAGQCALQAESLGLARLTRQEPHTEASSAAGKNKRPLTGLVCWQSCVRTRSRTTHCSTFITHRQ